MPDSCDHVVILAREMVRLEVSPIIIAVPAAALQSNVMHDERQQMRLTRPGAALLLCVVMAAFLAHCAYNWHWQAQLKAELQSLTGEVPSPSPDIWPRFRTLLPRITETERSVVSIRSRSLDGYLRTFNGCFVTSTGVVLTVAHGCKSPGTTFTVFANNARIPSAYALVWRDAERDLALLGPESRLTQAVPYKRIASDDTFEAGDGLTMCAHVRLDLSDIPPRGGKGWTRLQRTGTVISGYAPGYIRTSLPASDGLSGSPIFDTFGRLAGVMSARAVTEPDVAVESIISVLGQTDDAPLLADIADKLSGHK